MGLTTILGGWVKVKGLSADSNSIEDRIKPVVDLIKSKFGVQIFIEGDNKIFMYNVSSDLNKLYEKMFETEIGCRDFENDINRLIKDDNRDKALDLCDSVINDISISKGLKGCAYYKKGEVLYKLGKIEEAFDLFRYAIRLDYKEIESLNYIATALYENQKYEEALSIYNRLLDIKGYYPDIYGNIGLCLLQLHQYSKAVEHFDKAIECDDKDAFSYYNKGVTLYKMSFFDAAKTCMNKAIELDPNNVIYISEYNKAFGRD